MSLALKAGVLALACLSLAACDSAGRLNPDRALVAAGAALNSILNPAPTPKPRPERRAKTKKD